jgi:hypothetical protein
MSQDEQREVLSHRGMLRQQVEIVDMDIDQASQISAITSPTAQIAQLGTPAATASIQQILANSQASAATPFGGRAAYRQP